MEVGADAFKGDVEWRNVTVNLRQQRVVVAFGALRNGGVIDRVSIQKNGAVLALDPEVAQYLALPLRERKLRALLEQVMKVKHVLPAVSIAEWLLKQGTHLFGNQCRQTVDA